MRLPPLLPIALMCLFVGVWVPEASAAPSLQDRVEDLQQELDSLEEEIDDLEEPIAEFELFDQCMYLVGVSQYGSRDGAAGYWFGAGGRRRWPALAIDLNGARAPKFEFLAFPGEEPPSIECNEDAGEEQTDGE